MEADEWKPKDFGRRAYYTVPEDKNFKANVTLSVEGKVIARLQLREPGIVALVSKPDEEGFWVEVIEPGGIRYTDHQTPEALKEQQLAPWHQEALGVKE